MKFHVLNFDNAQRYEYDKEHVVISITSPGSGEAILPGNGLRAGLLRLQFHDIDRKIPGFMRSGYFSEEQARQIIDFALAYRELDFIVHCEAGISRSPAVAAALTFIFKGRGRDMTFFRRYLPNRHVYATLVYVWFTEYMEGKHDKP